MHLKAQSLEMQLGFNVSISFPSEWEEQEPLVTLVKAYRVSIQLVSPASGDIPMTLTDTSRLITFPFN